MNECPGPPSKETGLPTLWSNLDCPSLTHNFWVPGWLEGQKAPGTAVFLLMVWSTSSWSWVAGNRKAGPYFLCSKDQGKTRPWLLNWVKCPYFTLQVHVFLQQRAQSASMHHILGAVTHLYQFCLYQLCFDSGLKPWQRVKCFNNRKLMEEIISDVSSPPVVAGTVQTSDEKAISGQCWGRRNQHTLVINTCIRWSSSATAADAVVSRANRDCHRLSTTCFTLCWHPSEIAKRTLFQDDLWQGNMPLPFPITGQSLPVGRADQDTHRPVLDQALWEQVTCMGCRWRWLSYMNKVFWLRQPSFWVCLLTFQHLEGVGLQHPVSSCNNIKHSTHRKDEASRCDINEFSKPHSYTRACCAVSPIEGKLSASFHISGHPPTCQMQS